WGMARAGRPSSRLPAPKRPRRRASRREIHSVAIVVTRLVPEKKTDSPQRRRDAEKNQSKGQNLRAQRRQREALAGAPGADWASAFGFVFFSASLRLCGEYGAF